MNQQVFVAYLVDTLLLEAEEAKKRHLDLETKAEKLEAGTFPGQVGGWFVDPCPKGENGFRWVA